MSPSESLEPDPSNVHPRSVHENVNEAVGGTFGSGVGVSPPPPEAIRLNSRSFFAVEELVTMPLVVPSRTAWKTWTGEAVAFPSR